MYTDLLLKTSYLSSWPCYIGGGEEKTNCNWIDLKYRESFFNPLKDLQEEMETKKCMERP